MIPIHSSRNGNDFYAKNFVPQHHNRQRTTDKNDPFEWYVTM
jgi:hypothetical protein